MRPVLTPDAHRPPESATPSVSVAPALRTSLLGLARLALAVATGGAGASALDRALAQAPAGDTLGGVFVTLTEGGELRGCIGNLEPERPLRNAVVMAALGAALDDPRFLPVTAAELPLIRIDISVLGAPVLLTDPEAFEPGVDGVIVERGGRRALLLPEVATEFSWGAREMFEAVCRKAGLPADAWRDRPTTLRTFRTIRFGGAAMTMH
jgi:AmmeMemoRadiSam system protein A